MVFYKELIGIEEQIIRFDTMRSLFTLMTNGMETSSAEDLRNSLYYIEGSMEDMHKCLREKFDELWEAFKEIEPEQNIISSLKTNDYIQPQSLMLDQVMREMK